MAQPALSTEGWAQWLADPHGLKAVVINGVYVVRPDQAAAICLHGRITWEMVDAIRDAAEVLDDEHGFRYEGRHPRAVLAEQAADLLESLLPPTDETGRTRRVEWSEQQNPTAWDAQDPTAGSMPKPRYLDRHAGPVPGFPNIDPKLMDPDYKP